MTARDRGDIAYWHDPQHGPRFALTEGHSSDGRWVRPLNNPRAVVHAQAADVTVILTREELLALLNALHNLSARQGEPFGPKLAALLTAQLGTTHPTETPPR